MGSTGFFLKLTFHTNKTFKPGISLFSYHMIIGKILTQYGLGSHKGPPSISVHLQEVRLYACLDGTVQNILKTHILPNEFKCKENTSEVNFFGHSYCSFEFTVRKRYA